MQYKQKSAELMFGSGFDAIMAWWQSPSSQEAVWEGCTGGLELSVATLVATLVLELISFDTVRALHQKQSDGPALYRQAVFVNFFNHFVLGIPVYITAVLLFGRRSDGSEGTGGSLFASLVRVLGVIFIHEVLYYEAHKTMHSSSGWYRFHKFHHQFRQYIPPVSANAVTVVEYLMAYVIPFALATIVLRPTEAELRASVYVVSFANLLIHTPAYSFTSKYLEAVYLVSEHVHSEHHRKLTTNYAAPVVNIDRLIEWWTHIDESSSQESKQAE
jgi:sterol desaturase/sphingolipid hydroxylase (fatty acid hydroxylase superfamily)